MRPQKVLDKKIVESLVDVFRSKGYDGASLSELAEKTGLKKASLYHRFSDGKQGMAIAVMDYLGERAEEKVFRAIRDESVSPAKRLINGLNNIRDIYTGGKDACILRAFSLGSGLDLFGEQIESGMIQWVEAFKSLGQALGLSDTLAQEYAIKSLLEIQGSLVVTKGLNDLNIFEKTLKDIEIRYMNK